MLFRLHNLHSIVVKYAQDNSMNILKELLLPLRKGVKQKFIKVIFGEEDRVEYDLKSQAILKKIKTWLESKKIYIDIVGSGVYVEIEDDYIVLNGNWDNENYGKSNFTVVADFSGNLFDFQIDK